MAKADKDKTLISLPIGLKDEIKSIGYANLSKLVTSLLELTVKLDNDGELGKFESEILELNKNKNDELSVLIEQLKNNRRGE